MTKQQHTIQTTSIDKDTFVAIKNLKKGMPITKKADFLKVKDSDYVFCLYPKKDSSIFKKSYAFGLCYVFEKVKANILKPVIIYGYEVPVNMSLTKPIEIGKLDLKSCSFSIINKKCYDIIVKTVLVNAITNSNNK